MEYRQFGRTGVKVSPLCLGSMMFGGSASPEDSCRMIDRALDAGLNFIDTANVYSRGRSEETVGQALKRNGKRDRVFLATKVHGMMDADDPNGGGNSRRHILSECEASLRRLGTDRIDLYQIHRPQPQIPIDETLGALDDLVRAGKVRYLGTSNFAAWQLMESLMASREGRMARFVCEQPGYNLLDRSAERELVPFAQTYGLALIPWSPLGGGLLTGKYKRGTEAPEGARYSDLKNRPWLATRMHDQMYDVVERLGAVALAHGVPMSQFALAWCMHQPGVSAAIIGPRTYDQLEDNLKALEVTIDEEGRCALDAIVPPGSTVSRFYDADWGPAQYR